MLYKSLSTLAKGTDTHEVVEEYALDGGGHLKLKAKKVTVKTLAPDLSAIKLLLSMKSQDEYDSMSDQELEEERQKLFLLLQEN